jgi:hypothetical protein
MLSHRESLIATLVCSGPAAAAALGSVVPRLRTWLAMVSLPIIEHR